jgi:hypothetical protein
MSAGGPCERTARRFFDFRCIKRADGHRVFLHFCYSPTQPTVPVAEHI